MLVEDSSILQEYLLISEEFVKSTKCSPEKVDYNYRNRFVPLYNHTITIVQSRIRIYDKMIKEEEAFEQLHRKYAEFDLSTAHPIIKDNLVCPILKTILMDPVIAEDGYTYERYAIIKWFTQNAISPMTGLKIGPTLRANTVVKKMVSDII